MMAGFFDVGSMRRPWHAQPCSIQPTPPRCRSRPSPWRRGHDTYEQLHRSTQRRARSLRHGVDRLASLHEDMEMTEYDLDMDIWDLSQTARNIAEAWNDPTLRKQLEAERDSILSDIDLIRRTIVADEQAEVRRLQAELLALIKRRTA